MTKHSKDTERALVLAYLQAHGFVANSGIKYGLDFLVYTGCPDTVHSKYGLLIISENTDYKQVLCSQRVCNGNNKILLLARIDAGNKVALAQCERFIMSANRE